jgi:hypothetical protein
LDPRVFWGLRANAKGRIEREANEIALDAVGPRFMATP